LACRGMARASLFTWEKAARETWDIYREVLR
jgi:glycosyltransferase involved in cell wall biosynthesis